MQFQKTFNITSTVNPLLSPLEGGAYFFQALLTGGGEINREGGLKERGGFEREGGLI